MATILYRWSSGSGTNTGCKEVRLVGEDESVSQRRLKFAELATKRVHKATQAIRVIGNLSNKSNYEYTDQDVRLMIRELNAAVADVKRRFSNDNSVDSDNFRIVP